MDLEPGSAGSFSGTFPARLAEPLSQRRGDPARSFRYELRVRLQDQRFAKRVQRGAQASSTPTCSEKNTWGRRARAVPAAKNPVAYFSAEFGFHETLADRRRRSGNSGGRPRQIRQRSRPRLRRHQPVLSRRLFPAGDQPGQLADGILHAAQSAESADGAGAGRQGANRSSARWRSR